MERQTAIAQKVWKKQVKFKRVAIDQAEAEAIVDAFDASKSFRQSKANDGGRSGVGTATPQKPGTLLPPQNQTVTGQSPACCVPAMPGSNADEIRDEYAVPTVDDQTAESTQRGVDPGEKAVDLWRARQARAELDTTASQGVAPHADGTASSLQHATPATPRVQGKLHAETNEEKRHRLIMKDLQEKAETDKILYDKAGRDGPDSEEARRRIERLEDDKSH